MPSITTEATRRLPTLPTDEELAATTRLLEDAFNTTERIVWRVRQFSRLVEEDRAIPDVLPTNADVGRLFLFANHFGGRGEDFKRMSREVEQALPFLGEMPANAELMREASDDA
jgi:hypothetical protein